MNIKKILYIVFGIISTVLAIIGFVLPGLPVTPFLLLAAWLFAQSSKKLHNKLMSYSFVAKRVNEYNAGRGLTLKKKLFIIAFMLLMVLFSSFVILESGVARNAVLISGGVGFLVVAFVVPNAKKS